MRVMRLHEQLHCGLHAIIKMVQYSNSSYLTAEAGKSGRIMRTLFNLISRLAQYYKEFIYCVQLTQLFYFTADILATGISALKLLT